MTTDEKIGAFVGKLIAQAGFTAVAAWIMMGVWPYILGTHAGFLNLWAFTAALGLIVSVSIAAEKTR